MGVLSGLARFDSFSKSKEHVQVRTVSGATVSVVTFSLMALLGINEVLRYRRVTIEDHLMVDTSQGDREVAVSLDIDFPALKCADAELRVEDSKGILYDDARIHISKYPMDANGDAVAEGDSAIGCRLVGTMAIKRVAGNFHIAPRMHQMPHMMGGFAINFNPLEGLKFNATHVINHLSFGPDFPGQVRPLDGHEAAVKENPAMYQYHVKIVPTLFEPIRGALVDSNQFSATDFVQELTPQDGMMMAASPGVWFRYDFSPIMVRAVETRIGFLSFVVSLCAIVGGVFALSGLVDQLLYRSLNARKDK